MTMVCGSILHFLIVDASVFGMKLLGFGFRNLAVLDSLFDPMVLMFEPVVNARSAGMVFLPLVFGQTRSGKK